jgi:hypothetical protein
VSRVPRPASARTEAQRGPPLPPPRLDHCGCDPDRECLEVIEKKVKVERGLIVEYRVDMKITFLLE